MLKVEANQRDLQEAIRNFFAHAPPAGGVVAQASQTRAHASWVETRTLCASTGLDGSLLGWAGLGQGLWLERRGWQRGSGETLASACAITSLLPAHPSTETRWPPDSRKMPVRVAGHAERRDEDDTGHEKVPSSSRGPNHYFASKDLTTP